MRRLLLPALAAAPALPGCATGEGSAADVDDGGEFRFEAGTPQGEVIAPDDRARAPEFSGALLDGERFSSTELAGDVAVPNVCGSWCVLGPDGRVAAVNTAEVPQDDLRRVIDRTPAEDD